MDAAIREENGALAAALAGDMDLEDYGKARAPSRDRVARGRVDFSGPDRSAVKNPAGARQAAAPGAARFMPASPGETAVRVLRLAKPDKMLFIHSTIDTAPRKAPPGGRT